MIPIIFAPSRAKLFCIDANLHTIHGFQSVEERKNEKMCRRS